VLRVDGDAGSESAIGEDEGDIEADDARPGDAVLPVSTGNVLRYQRHS